MSELVLAESVPLGCTYTPGPGWTEPMLKARESMPTLAGCVVSLFDCPRGKLKAYEAEWRQWARQHPKELWPVMLHEWSAHKKRLTEKGRE